MRVGDRVAYIGKSWLGLGMMKMYPDGAVVVDIREGAPILMWPSGGEALQELDGYIIAAE